MELILQLAWTFKNMNHLLDTSSSSCTFYSQSEVDRALLSLQACFWTALGSCAAAPIWHHSSDRCAGMGSIHPKAQRYWAHSLLEYKQMKNTLLILQNIFYFDWRFSFVLLWSRFAWKLNPPPPPPKKNQM